MSFKINPQEEEQDKEQEIAPCSRRYDLRISRKKKEIGQNNVSRKRKAGHLGHMPVKKRLKAREPCDRPLELRWATNPLDQGPKYDVGIAERHLGIAERDPRSLVGGIIEVYWPMEEGWYSGKVVLYDGYNKLHLVAYEDGEEEWVSLRRDKIRLVEASTTLSKTSTSSNKRNSAKIRLLEASTTISKTPTSSNKRNSEQEAKSKHGAVEQSGGGIKAVQGTTAIAYRRKRKSVNISKQDDFDKESYSGIKQGKHGGANDSIQISVIGGDVDSEQKASRGSLKRHTRKYKRIKKDSKQVEISGTDDVGVRDVSDQVENAGVGVVSDLQHKDGVHEMRTTDDVSEPVVIHTCPEQGSFGCPKTEIKSKPVTRFTYKRRRQSTSKPLSSGRPKVGNSDAVVHQRLVDADSKTDNAFEGTELVQPIQWLEKKFTVEDALNIYTSPLSLRQPSYWQCVAHAMQLCKRGNLEMVKSRSSEDLMFVLGSVLHFFSAIDKKSTSYPFMGHFRARFLNSSESGTILREYFKQISTLSDIDVQVCFVRKKSSIGQLHFRISFEKVLSNVPEYGVYKMGNRSIIRTASLHAVLESFSVCFTSLKTGPCCPLIRNSENIHCVQSAEDNDLSFMSKAQLLSNSSGGSAANDGTLALVPIEGHVNYAHDTGIINVSQQSSKSICFGSPIGFLDHSENVCGGSHIIQSLQMSYPFGPSHFTSLHQRLLLVRNSYNQLSFQPLPQRLPRTKREYRRMLVRSECNDSLVGKSWSVRAYSPLVSSSKNDCKDNRHCALPVLKFQKFCTDFDKWCCELNFPSGNGHKAYGRTRDIIRKRLENPIRFCTVDSPNGLLRNVHDVPSRSTRPGRRARRCKQEKRSEKLNGSVMDFSKPGSELDSLSCTTNILVVIVDRGWRESGAEVTLKSPYTNEWTLDVKLHGFSRFTYKPPNAKICKTQERIARVPGQVHNRSKSHITIWKSGGDWSLEFPNRHQWILFKKLYKECYERNNGFSTFKHKDIPLPGVNLLDNDCNLDNDIGPFSRPFHYIKAEDEVRKATSSTRVLYDMDSDDERWLCQFNSNASDKISDENFERIINELEKLVFLTQPHLTINDAVKILSDLIPVEVLRSIYSYWEEKRNKKGTALVRQFQLGISKQTLSKNSSVESSKGKQRPVMGSPSSRSRNQGIGVPGYKITLKNQGIGVQHGQQQQKANAIPLGNESSSHSLGPISCIDAGLQKDEREIDAYLKSKGEICAVTQERVHKAASQTETQTEMEIDTINIGARLQALREICTDKRRRVQRLTQNFDLKAYIAGKAVRNAEVKKARPLCIGGNAVSLKLSADGRANANTAIRECSMGSSYWALAATGH